jgi:hypothetical protein
MQEMAGKRGAEAVHKQRPILEAATLLLKQKLRDAA